MKKVKLVKRRRFKYRILVYIFLVFIGYEISYNIMMNRLLARTNETFVKAMLVDSNYHMLYDKKASDLFTKVFSYFFNINEPVSILENTFHYKANSSANVSYVSAIKKEEKEPLVYIYNSHQAESYVGDSLEPYNITPGVMMASYIFQDKLQNIGVKSIVLEDDLINYMNTNNIKYVKSYEVSRKFITDTINNTPSLKLIIDLHRDSIAKDNSTVMINDKACAKIVFIVGNEYDEYQKNLELSNKLNDKIKEKYPSLTRGVLIKGGAGSNGVYNQDLNPKMVLLEVGGDKNTISEILNTIELLAPIIGEYVNES